MTIMRAFFGGLLLCALAACDSDQPAQPTVPRSEPAETALPVPTAPAVAVPAPESDPEPADEPKPLSPREASLPSPAPSASGSSRAARPSRTAVPPLDLSLPSDILERFKLPGDVPGDPLEPAPLLPPLFVEKPNEPESFELGGKLITSERPEADDDSWHSVDGVELQLQFRR